MPGFATGAWHEKLFILSETAAIRRTVYFSGTVQGVGFRYTTRNTAAGFDVSGYVRNLSDGRVELVAEGCPDELDGFQRAVLDAMRPYVTDSASTDGAASGEFTSFTIAM